MPGSLGEEITTTKATQADGRDQQQYDRKYPFVFARHCTSSMKPTVQTHHRRSFFLQISRGQPALCNHLIRSGHVPLSCCSQGDSTGTRVAPARAAMVSLRHSLYASESKKSARIRQQ